MSLPSCASKPALTAFTIGLSVMTCFGLLSAGSKLLAAFHVPSSPEPQYLLRTSFRVCRGIIAICFISGISFTHLLIRSPISGNVYLPPDLTASTPAETGLALIFIGIAVDSAVPSTDLLKSRLDGSVSSNISNFLIYDIQKPPDCFIKWSNGTTFVLPAAYRFVV